LTANNNDDDNNNNLYELPFCSQQRMVISWIQAKFFDWLQWHKKSTSSVLQYSAPNALKPIIF
jgi:hypothetical protein